jgi:hypothetical protein
MQNPCQPVRYREDDGWLVRFFYYHYRISLEVFHAVSDGAGSLPFFRTLLAVYLRELGHAVPGAQGILDVDEPPRREEREDAYLRYAHRPVEAGHRGDRKAYQGNGTPEPFYTLNVTMGLVPLDKLRAVARSYAASVTEYLAAVLIQSLLAKQRREGRRRELPVALAVPINLRPHFPSETLRNFILTVRPSIDPELGDYTFPEIVRQVPYYMRLHINRQRCRRSTPEMWACGGTSCSRSSPSPSRTWPMALSYKLVGQPAVLYDLTNPGAFQVPAEMEPHIRAHGGWFWVRPIPHAPTAPPSATATPWRSPSPVR